MGIVIDTTKDSADIVNQNLQGVRQSAQLMSEIRARQQEMRVRKLQVASEYAKAGMNPPPGLLDDTILPSQNPGLMGQVSNAIQGAGRSIGGMFGGGQPQTQSPTQMPASQLPSQSGVISPTGMTRDQFIQANMDKLPPGLLNQIGQQEYASKFGESYDKSLTSQKTTQELKALQTTQAQTYAKNIVDLHPEFKDNATLFPLGQQINKVMNSKTDDQFKDQALAAAYSEIINRGGTFDRQAMNKTIAGRGVLQKLDAFLSNGTTQRFSEPERANLANTINEFLNTRAESHNKLLDNIGNMAEAKGFKREDALAGLEPYTPYTKKYSVKVSSTSGSTGEKPKSYSKLWS